MGLWEDNVYGEMLTAYYLGLMVRSNGQICITYMKSDSFIVKKVVFVHVGRGFWCISMYRI